MSLYQGAGQDETIITSWRTPKQVDLSCLQRIRSSRRTYSTKRSQRRKLEFEEEDWRSVWRNYQSQESFVRIRVQGERNRKSDKFYWSSSVKSWESFIREVSSSRWSTIEGWCSLRLEEFIAISWNQIWKSIFGCCKNQGSSLLWASVISRSMLDIVSEHFWSWGKAWASQPREVLATRRVDQARVSSSWE